MSSIVAASRHGGWTRRRPTGTGRSRPLPSDPRACELDHSRCHKGGVSFFVVAGETRSGRLGKDKVTEPTGSAILLVLLILEIKHFICDYPLQRRYQLENKGKYGHFGGILHAGIHSVGTAFAFLVITPTLGIAALILVGEFVIHYHIDWAKQQLMARSKATVSDDLYLAGAGFRPAPAPPDIHRDHGRSLLRRRLSSAFSGGRPRRPSPRGCRSCARPGSTGSTRSGSRSADPSARRRSR